MITRGLAAWLLATVLFTSAAVAHGGVGMVDNRCVLRIGPNLMFFSGHQPQNSREEFCDDIPSVGQTVVVLDMQDTELRDMLTEIRIIKDKGNHTTINGLPFLTDAELGSPQVLDPVTITYVQPKKYPTGTLTFEHTFPETGKFIGIVTVKNGHGQTYVSQFPFSVGQQRVCWSVFDSENPSIGDQNFMEQLCVGADGRASFGATNTIFGDSVKECGKVSAKGTTAQPAFDVDLSACDGLPTHNIACQPRSGQKWHCTQTWGDGSGQQPVTLITPTQ